MSCSRQLPMQEITARIDRTELFRLLAMTANPPPRRTRASSEIAALLPPAPAIRRPRVTLTMPVYVPPPPVAAPPPPVAVAPPRPSVAPKKVSRFVALLEQFAAYVLAGLC